MIEAKETLIGELLPKGDKGDRGYSAYELYVRNGGTLSEAEWLESLKGKQGPQGEPGAVKMQVVEVLAEVGEIDTIYLLKKDVPEEQNTYDEYIYNKESGWEHIGDTSVDLTDYYTKEETDKKLDKFSYILDIESNIDTSSAFGGDKTSIWKTALENAINGWLEKQEEVYTDTSFRRKLALRFYCGNISSGNNTLLFTPDGSVSSSDMIYYCDYISPNSYTSSIPTYLSIGKRLVTITATMISGRISISKIVFSSNTARFYPDKYTLPIASTETLGGIKLGEGLSADENGVVSAAGGSESACYSIEFNNVNLPQYSTIYSSEFGDYKQTLLDFISNALNDSYKKNQTPVIFMNFKCSNYISSIPYFILSKSDAFNILNPSANGQFYMLSDIKIVNDKIYYYRVSINYTYENNIFTCTNIKFDKTQRNMLDIYNALSKENTTSFTPTGDYNPSTKLYTDKTHYENMTGYDATKTQVLKNVNGTLTWVNE